MLKAFLYIILLFLVTMGSVSSQDTVVVRKHYNLKEGMPDVHVTDLLEEENGMLWIGTLNGLSRFDGYNFERIDLPDRRRFRAGSRGPRIARVLPLKDGKIAITYFQAEDIQDSTIIDVVDVNTLKVFPAMYHSYEEISDILLSSKNKLSSTATLYRSEDTKGNIVEIYSGEKEFSGVLKIIGRKEIDITPIVKQFQTFVTPAGRDFSKNIYFKMRTGMLHCVLEKNPFDVYLQDKSRKYEYGNRIRAISDIDDTTVLVSVESSNLKGINLNSSQVFDLNLKDNISKNLLSSNHLLSIHPYGNDSMFATRFQKDPIIFNKKNYQGRTSRANFVQFCMHSISLKDGRIALIGKSKKYGVYALEIIDPKDESSVLYKLTGHLLYNRVNNSFLYSNDENIIWIGNSNGLLKFDLRKGKVVRAYTKLETEEFESRFPVHKVFTNNSVLVIDQLKSGELIVGLEKGGLNVLNLKTNNVQAISVNDGLSNDIPAGLIVKEKGVWVSTYNGLNYWDLKENNFRAYFTENGLPNNEFNRFSFFESNSGELFFGGMNGLVAFQPEDLISKDAPLQITLTEAHYYEPNRSDEIKRFDFSDDIPEFQIGASNRLCNFHFMLSDLRNVEANKFSYKLRNVGFFEESETDWQSLPSGNILSFDFLPSGKYEIDVRGVSAEGEVSDVKTIKLNISEYFYKTWWFLLLSVLLIASIFYIIYRFRIRQIMEIQGIKTQLSSDLHDDVGSLLSGVAFQMEILESQVAEDQKPLVQRIAKSSRQAMDQMRDVVWAIDSRQNQTDDLIGRMRDFCINVLEPLDWEYTFEVNEKGRTLELASKIKHELLLIYKEFVNNALKYSNGDTITLNLHVDNQDIRFYLHDNGHGFDAKDIATSGTGLSNFKYRAQKLKAQFEFISDTGFGIQLNFKRQ